MYIHNKSRAVNKSLIQKLPFTALLTVLQKED